MHARSDAAPNVADHYQRHADGVALKSYVVTNNPPEPQKFFRLRSP